MTERTATYIFAAVMGIPVYILVARLWWYWTKVAIDTWRVPLTRESGQCQRKGKG